MDTYEYQRLRSLFHLCPMQFRFIYSNISVVKPLGPLKPNFMLLKFVQMVIGIWPKWSPCLYTCTCLVKPFKISSESKRPMTLELGVQHWRLGPYKVCSNFDCGLTLTCFTASSNLHPNDFVLENAYPLDLIETFVVTELKISTNSWLNECMYTYEYLEVKSLFNLRFIL